YALLSILDLYPVNFAGFGKIAGLYTLAWLIGYLVPGASGGIGIRETMLLLLLHTLYPQETILAAAFSLRILSILSEVLTYLFSMALFRRRAFHAGVTK
ncbi:MAG: hypothetical protein LBP21_10085, partial [Synergistaceae bacterium]|nr:hypothetical protein [Synergistaceae bacterium]